MKRIKAKSIFGALCSFFAISLFSAFCSITLNTVSVSAYSITVTTSGSMTADVFPAAGDNIGTTIVTDNVGVISNCRAGYTLSISGPSDNNLYLNGSSSNNTTGTYFTPVDGTNALNSTVNANKWGYSLTATTQNGIFTPLSDTANTLLTPSQTASPNSDINTVIPVYYGTSVNKDMPPGSYTFSNNNAITYNVVMDATCMVVNIAYDGNNADAGTMGAAGTGVIHTGVKDGDTVNLIASNFSRTGYGFAGWSTDQNAGAKLIDNDNTNNPIVYGPQETITLPNGFIDNDTDNDGIVKLYAVWIPSQGNLQGWAGCANLDTTTYDSTTGALDLTKKSVTALTDQRDNDTYAVARLADGNCWMIENLRLDNDAAHNSDGLLAQGYGTSSDYGNFAGLADPESINFSNSTTANSLYYSSTQSGTANVNIGTTNFSGYRMPRYNNANTSARASNPTTNNVAMHSYGNYYTWHAALANTTYYSGSNAIDADGKTSETVNTSLCPTGWRLPYGGNTGNGIVAGGFYNLNYKINNDSNVTNAIASLKLRSFPNNFLYSGGFNESSTSNRGSNGYYWSSTVGNFELSYRLFLSSTTVSPGMSNYYKYYGSSIRCVASEPETYTLTYDANGGSGAPSSPEPVYASGIAIFTVSNSVPARSGYAFAGWIDEKGNETQPGASFTTKDPNAVLYAIWTNNSCNPTATTIGTGNTSTDAVCLQDVTLNMKAALPIATATTGTYNLIDARDGQSYTVAKLADGNLWLTKNLNYGSSSDTLLTSYDTDLPSGKAFKAPASTTAFETANNDATYVSPKILTDSTYGGYYSFAAAIASVEAYSTTNQNITTSICPKGWDLPTSAIYNNLRTTSGNTTYAKMNAAPYSFIYAGYRNGTSFSGQTNSIRLWTSTNSTAPYAYYTTAYDTASTNYKRYGKSVRCIASNGTATINYNANGGTGTMTGQTGDINSTTVKSNSFTAPTNRQFRNWNTKADGTGTTVAAGTLASSIVSDGDSITLYAQWDEVYYITFNANGGSGTMTNQTVVRDTATVIKTSTFTRSGFIFRGWNTKDDGTGTFYSDGQKVTNLTTTGNTITLYAVWVEGAYLDTGRNVNQKLKRLAGNSSATYSTQDNTIAALVRSNTLPNDFTSATENTISHSSSPYPIYAWYDSTNTTIYYYSEAANIMMNKDSSNFFNQMRALSDLSTISTWDTAKVTTMSSMFTSAGRSATTWSVGGLSSWNTSSVTDMQSMFSSAGFNATTWSLGDLSSWNTSNVTSMNSMFSSAGINATTFTLNLSSWDTSSVTNMSYMFSNAGLRATTWSVGDLSSWDTSSVTSMSSMFDSAGHSATTFTLNLSSWNTSSVTNMQSMFSSAGRNATTWSIGNLSSWDTSSVTNMSSMFDSAGYSATTFTLDLSSWSTSNVKDMYDMFSSAGFNATTWSLGDLSSWNTSNVTSMNSMFSSAGRSATTWSVGGLSSWNTSNVTNMYMMFSSAGYNATTFTLNLSSWDTSSVTNMSYMFSNAGYSASTFTLDLSSWNTSNVTNMYMMFHSAGYSASTFTLDLSSWNTSSVTNMSNMFNIAGSSATTWSVTIPKTNNGTATGPILNTTSNLYGNTTSVTATPPSGRSFTLAN